MKIKVNASALQSTYTRVFRIDTFIASYKGLMMEPAQLRQMGTTVRSGYKKLLIKKPRLVRNSDEKTGFFLVRDKKPRSIRKFLNFL